ncbi:hypothetical protein Ato02nite_005730 [Paractinoplanes toevensis]|uniref:C2H2-type domain-containing protein n=1 Tax=Paractinoplanes toevensis TaxID=571911 RepID=A0A919T6J0_9ACTN|nr:hypothetical protein Ato02nite_005730 [Actinoplanes toevensis]
MEEPYNCDWDGQCTRQFATRDDLHAHELDHWSREDALNTHLREGVDWRDRRELNR